jgi:hypothetical protein
MKNLKRRLKPRMKVLRKSNQNLKRLRPKDQQRQCLTKKKRKGQ